VLKNGFASTKDRLLIKRARNAEEALNHIKSFYSVFDSLRYIREKTILILKTPLSPEFLEKLSGEFQDILLKDKIESTEPFKKNSQTKNILHYLEFLSILTRKALADSIY
jgi:hypothetical protein